MTETVSHYSHRMFERDVTADSVATDQEAPGAPAIRPVGVGRGFEAMLEQLPNPAWVIAADGTMRMTNSAAATTLGYRRAEELNGRPSHDTVHERYLDGTPYPEKDCPVVRPSRGRSPRSSREHFIKRDGTVFPICWQSRPLDINGFYGTLLSFHDMSWLEEAESWQSRPNQERQRTKTPRQRDRDRLYHDVRATINANAADPQLSPGLLASRHHVSLRLLQSVIADHNDSPAHLIRSARLLLAKGLILDGCSVATAAYRSGFTDLSTFSRNFKRTFNVAASAMT